MAGIKESLSVQVQSSTLALQESTITIRGAFQAMPPLKRTIVLFLLIVFIPLFLAVRYGGEKILSARYARVALSAHPSYAVTLSPIVGDVKLLLNPNGSYSAYAKITNRNLDLSATNISYKFTFQNASGETIHTVANTLYLLPNEEKNLVVPRIDAREPLTRASLTIGGEQAGIDWEKRISIPTVQLRVSEPTLTEDVNPLMLSAEGSVVNNSPYDLQAVRLVFFLYDDKNNVIGVSQRDEFTIPAFGRRAYKQTWPGLYKADVERVQVNAYTNTMDPQNLTVKNQATPTVDDRQDSNDRFSR